MARRTATVLLAAAVAGGALALPAPAAAASTETYDQLKSPLVSRINEVRAARGLKKLRVAPRLTNAATRHATSMGKSGYFSHHLLTSRGMASFSAWIRWYWPGPGYSSWSAGENLYCATFAPSARAVVRAWMQSRGHRANLLSKRWRNVGVAAVRTQGWKGSFHGCAGNVTIVAAEFGRRS